MINVNINQSILWRSGDSFAKQEDWENAIFWYEHAAKLVSNNVEDFRNNGILERKIAYCYLQLRKYDLALDSCSKGIYLIITISCINRRK